MEQNKKKTWVELQPGDKFYVVNEGELIGHVRLEEYVVEKPIHINEKIPTWYTLTVKDFPFDHHFIAEQLTESSCGFMFTDLDEAKEYYKNKIEAVLPKLMKELKELEEKYNSLSDSASKIYLDYMEMTNPETLSTLMKDVERKPFEPIKMYNTEEDDTNV